MAGGRSPLSSILSNLLKVFGLHFAPSEVVLQVVFVAFSWATLLSVSFDQFTKEQLFGDALVTHSDDMTCPTQLGLQQHRFDGGGICSVQNFEVGDFVLPSNLKDATEGAHVELLQLSDVAPVHCPGLASIQE
jgi:hypothetical protein